MNITKVTSGTLKEMNIKSYVPEEIKSEEVKGVKSTQKADSIQTEKEPFSANWQRDILLDALERLENTVQLDNSHPLDTNMNQPIETYEEALIELSFIQNPVFLAQASGAQANIVAESVMELFADEPELIN